MQQLSRQKLLLQTQAALRSSAAKTFWVRKQLTRPHSTAAASWLRGLMSCSPSSLAQACPGAQARLLLRKQNSLGCSMLTPQAAPGCHLWPQLCHTTSSSSARLLAPRTQHISKPWSSAQLPRPLLQPQQPQQQPAQPGWTSTIYWRSSATPCNSNSSSS
jgi:hypothetical protein